jgi:SLT domain-containing protein
MFMINKALLIKEAIMNTAAGVTAALKLGPFGIPLAFGIGALGAVQVATIARQEYTGRRLGGPVQKDRPYMVGESGKEMFVPNQSGEIIPNNQLGKAVTVNFNINTVDARGFNELLVNSRGVIVNMINSAVNEKGRMAIV